ncbi:MAG: DNA-3-methyladenine glycosylase [Methylotenera sp.]|nr:MAG: DNA-3-methyladenine glycosylase [Methylotenera sp.]
MHTHPYQIATDFLSAQDVDWAQLIKIVGPCVFEPKAEREPYEALVRAIAYQQLHGKAGDAILKRFKALFADTFPTPQQILATEFEALRACGFSARKIETIQAIAQGTISGLIPQRLEADEMSDEALITQLITLKGIGRWTVEMMLMFTLQRMDILPVDDFAVVEGYKRLKKLAAAPKRKDMQLLGEAWSPYRTIASWYLWRVPK